MKLKYLFLLSFLLITVGCRTLGGFGGFTGGTGKAHNSNVFSKKVLYLAGFVAIAKTAEELSKCDYIKEISSKSSGGAIGQSHAQEQLKGQAVKLGADTILITKNSGWNTSETQLEGKAYRCDKDKNRDINLLNYGKDLHINSDIAVFVGSYLKRHGILRELGSTGPTIGISYSDFSGRKDKIYNSHGFFILWTIDHFWRTNSKLLKPKFFDENFTNYMLGGGYSFRYIYKNDFQFHYKGGLALNFIEIDTFGGGGTEKDKEYSDVTVSTIHKVSLDFLVLRKKNPVLSKEVRIGPSLFYYFAPEPMGKFSNDTKSHQTGGSFAWSLDIVWENY